MSESEKKKNPPLMVKQKLKKEHLVRPLPYQIGSDTYEVYSNTKNPYLSRITAPETETVKLDPQNAASLFQKLANQRYELNFPTNASPYRRRKVAAPAGAPVAHPEFAEPQKLKESEQKLYLQIELFFTYVLERLKEDPYSLPVLINELVPYFVERQIRIKVYEIYRRFPSWDKFMYTLEQISQDYELENFELFCGALFGFYSQLQ